MTFIGAPITARNRMSFTLGDAVTPENHFAFKFAMSTGAVVLILAPNSGPLMLGMPAVMSMLETNNGSIPSSCFPSAEMISHGTISSSFRLRSDATSIDVRLSESLGMDEYRSDIC